MMAIKNVAERALAYGMPSKIVDGNNVVEVFTVAKDAYDMARNGGGPTFIECKTMRMHGHSEHDSAKYVPRELLEEWKKKDPILNMEKYLLENNIAKKEELDGIDSRVKKEVERLVICRRKPVSQPEDGLRTLCNTHRRGEI
jgi:pyruvate dehydrogenase E1 component alpha subunit